MRLLSGDLQIWEFGSAWGSDYFGNGLFQVAGYVGEDQLGQALEGSDLVVIPAGVPRKPGMTRDDLFNINAGIVKSLCTAIAKYCPNVSNVTSFCEFPDLYRF